MGREKQQLLSKDDPPEEEEVDRDQHLHTEECHKKHGVFCRIMTALHLKKRSTEHEKLLSQSQEHLPAQSGGQNQKRKPKEKRNSKKVTEKEKAAKFKREPKILSSRGRSFTSNSNSNNNVFATTYEMLDNESHCSDCESPFEPDPCLENVHVKEKQPIEHVTIRNVHIYGDANFGESCISKKDDNPLLEKDSLESPTTGRYIRHQWHGKRAKKARKRIRRVMRSTWLSLQSATNVSNVFPSPQTVATAVANGNRR